MPALQAQGRQIHLQSLQLVDETAIVDQTGGGAPPTNKRTKKKWSHKYSQTKQNNKDTRPMRGLYKEITPLPILLIQPTQLSVFLNITHHWDTTLHRATAYYIVFILYYTTHHVITCCATLHTCTLNLHCGHYTISIACCAALSVSFCATLHYTMSHYTTSTTWYYTTMQQCKLHYIAPHPTLLCSVEPYTMLCCAHTMC